LKTNRQTNTQRNKHKTESKIKTEQKGCTILFSQENNKQKTTTTTEKNVENGRDVVNDFVVLMCSI
jgi:hypothetical protein